MGLGTWSFNAAVGYNNTIVSLKTQVVVNSTAFFLTKIVKNYIINYNFNKETINEY